MNITVQLEVPSVPNYIFHAASVGNRQDGFVERPKVDVADFTDAQLIEIAREWGLKLVANAKNRRELRKLDRTPR